MQITRASLIIHFLFFFSFEAVSSTGNSNGLKNIVELAYKNNLVLKEKEAQIYAIDGKKKEAAGILFNNPELSSSKGWRKPLSNNVDAEKKSEWGIGVSQVIEISGKQGIRSAAADADFLSLQAEYEDLKKQVRMEASVLYYNILYIQEKIKLDEKTLSLFEQAEKIAKARKEAGEDTLLDVNFAGVEKQMAMNDLINTKYNLTNAKSLLATLIQVQDDELPEMKGRLDNEIKPFPYSYEVLKDKLKNKPEIIALSYQEQSNKKLLDLEEKSVYPDITLAINYSKDGSASARESLTSLSVSIPLPVFQRNFSAVGLAKTNLVQANIKKEEAYNRNQKEMQDLWRKINSVKENIDILKNNVIPLSLKNDELASSSQKIGQVGLTDLILINRQTISANQRLLDALLEYHVTRLTLERVVGLE